LSDFIDLLAQKTCCPGLFQSHSFLVVLASAFTAPDKPMDGVITLSKIFHLQLFGGM
jgi:hypothetical protein